MPNESITSIRCSNSYNAEGSQASDSASKFKSHGNLTACQEQCDIFSSFTGCNWFILFNPGPAEDCYLYNPSAMTMEEWLDTHNIRGQPVLGCPAQPIDVEEKCVTPPDNQFDAGSPIIQVCTPR